MKKSRKARSLKLPFRANEIPESLLQFIWRYQYFNSSALCTTKGEALSVIFPGKLNTNQGPDFLDAKVRIDETLLAGSVELHLRSSQWQQHGHHHDPNYHNVILHVVFEDDLPGGGVPHLPVLELQGRIPSLLLERFDTLMHTPSFIPCEQNIAAVPELVMLSWKDRMVAERLTRKGESIMTLACAHHYHWEEVFWWLLARNFGMNVNADAFEAVARSLPLNLLGRHRSQLLQLEALLLGQAGLLDGTFSEKYPQMLQKEYSFLKKKYGLKPAGVPVHFLRMRPQNFPTLRLAQLAALVQKADQPFARILEMEDLPAVKAMLEVCANDYWHYHYRFDELSAFREKTMGATMIDNLVINSVVPVLFAYGLYLGKDKIKTKALTWLEQIKPENNQLIRAFSDQGVSAVNALDTQALLEMKAHYCDQRQCLACAIGNELLKIS